jgi:hypothetical protein
MSYDDDLLANSTYSQVGYMIANNQTSTLAEWVYSMQQAMEYCRNRDINIALGPQQVRPGLTARLGTWQEVIVRRDDEVSSSLAAQTAESYAYGNHRRLFSSYSDWNVGDPKFG